MSVMRGLTLTEKEQTRLQTMNGVVGREWTVAEAAQVLGLSERHAWRLLARYRNEGAVALAHGNRGRVPHNATPTAVQVQIVTLARDRYGGVNHTHLTELLEEREDINLSRSTVRRILTGAGLPSHGHRQPRQHRHRRQRMPQEGMLLQIDGSYHQWLGEDGPWLTLLLAIDDATGTVPFALFREQEDSEGYFMLMRGVIQAHGIPLAVYSDRHFIFCYSKPGTLLGEASVIDRGKPTQFGRAMQELGVTQIFARSPEAKGRVERANGTFQDRLVSELRLAGARTLEEANGVLEAFLPRYNRRFGVPAAQVESAYRPLDTSIEIDGILCFKERRRVGRDNTVQYHGQTLQLFPGKVRRSYARTRIEVQRRLDGRLVAFYRGELLTPQEAPPLAASLRAGTRKYPKPGFCAELTPYCPTLEAQDEARMSEPRVIWYEDSRMMAVHRQLVKAGMEKARQQGKRIGRPRVTDRPQFIESYHTVLMQIREGTLSRRKAARQLNIGYATLKRYLDAGPGPTEPNTNRLLIPIDCGSRCSALSEVID
jgi:transposase